MKSHIVISVLLMYKTAYHMLAGMLLHQIKTALPVDLPMNLTSFFQSLVYIMNQLSVFFLNILYFRLSKTSNITGLSAPFRIKSALVQNNRIPLYTHFHNIDVLFPSYLTSFLKNSFLLYNNIFHNSGIFCSWQYQYSPWKKDSQVVPLYQNLW